MARLRLTSAAALLALLLVPTPREAAATDPAFRTPFLGPDGQIRLLYRPEFRDAPSLLEDLGAFGIEGLEATLIGPTVASPVEKEPAVPSRILLAGQPEVVARTREVLSYLDVPRPAVVVSLLAAEVRRVHDAEHGSSILWDRNVEAASPDTLFRSAQGSYEPESFLRSSLTGYMPFQGTTLAFGNSPGSWERHGVFELVLRMLQEEREAVVLAWPTVMCTEGEVGLIESIVELPDRVVTRSGASFRIQSDSVQSGLILKVIPVRVARGGAVLDLVADIGMAEPENPSDIPASDWIQRRRAVATRVTIRDRESIVIGGLKLRRFITRTQGDPILGQVPALEYLASSGKRTCMETELLLVLRGRVLVPGARGGVVLPPGEARRLQAEARSRPGQLGER